MTFKQWLKDFWLWQLKELPMIVGGCIFLAVLPFILMCVDIIK